MATSRTQDRVRLVQRLASQDNAEATDGLLSAAAESSAYVAQLAIDALSERATWEIAGRLVPLFEKFQNGGAASDSGCYLRTAIAHIFGRLEFLPGSDCMRVGIRTVQIEAVGGVRNDVATQLRAACALALAEMRDPAALREITPLLFDTGHNRIGDHLMVQSLNPELRVVAARAIGRLGNADGLAVLSIKLMFPSYETDREVIAECMNSAMILGKDDALPLVAPYIRERGHPLAASAAMSIIQADVEAGYSLVTAAVEQIGGSDLKAIALALAARRSSASIGLLFELASSQREDARAAFAGAVAVTGDQSAIPVLQALAGDRSRKVADAARAALAAILPSS